MDEKRIIYNAIRTPDGTVLHSKHTHDFIKHKDANGKTYYIDGGNAYLGRIGDMSDIIDISKYDDGKHETRRRYLCWGKNFDKDMNRLPKTEWVYIMHMETGHIESILKGGYADKFPLMKSIFEEELKYREDE